MFASSSPLRPLVGSAFAWAGIQSSSTPHEGSVVPAGSLTVTFLRPSKFGPTPASRSSQPAASPSSRVITGGATRIAPFSVPKPTYPSMGSESIVW